MGKVVGIDLGTSNSCVAVMESGASHGHSNRGNAGTTRAIVRFVRRG